jgi:hypothetical protein
MLNVGMSSCGLESGVYQFSPPLLTTAGTNGIKISHNLSANGDLVGLLGYDLYYRFFDAAQNAEASISAMSNFSSAATSTPEKSIAELKRLGFSLVKAKAPNAQGSPVPDPIFSVANPAISDELFITMEPDRDWACDDTDNDSVFVLVRNYVSSFSQSSSFATNLIEPSPSSDPTSYDYEGTAPKPTHIALFALARAMDQNNVLSFTYSQPNGIVVELP